MTPITSIIGNDIIVLNQYLPLYNIVMVMRALFVNDDDYDEFFRDMLSENDFDSSAASIESKKIKNKNYNNNII